MAESFSEFLKQNKRVAPEVEYAPTRDFTDKNGDPLKWRFRAITSDQFNAIRDKCTYSKQIPGKYGQYTKEVNNDQLNDKMIVACTIYPNLENAELQDSYGVSTPEALMHALVSLPGEYADLVEFASNLCGFGTSIEEKVDEVKNS